MKQQIKCPKCQTPLQVENPELKAVDHPDCSFMFGVHESGVDCAQCGGYFKPRIAQVEGVAWLWVEAEKPIDTTAKIILPHGLKLAH